MSARRLAAKVAIALALLAMVAPAVASATEQGVYEGCSPGTSQAALDRCTDRLARIRAAGFDVVLNYSSWYSSEANLGGYASAAERLGLKLIWPLNGAYWRDPPDNLTAQYKALAATCACDDDAGFTAYAVGLMRARPATWGWYVGDEIPAPQRADAAALSERVGQLDHGHPRLLISLESAATAGANLAPFLGLTEYAGADIYPVGTGQGLDSVATVGRGVRGLVEPAGGRVAMVLQSFSLAAYPALGRPDAPWPTGPEMRAMRDHALASARPDLVLWYSAQDILDRSPDPDGLFAQLAWAATAPPVTQLAGARVTGRTVDASFSSDAAGAAECRIDGHAWEPCASPFHAGGLELGGHALEVRERDLLGHTGAAATDRFTVAPVVISGLRAPRRVMTRRARLRRRAELTSRCPRLRACPAARRRLSAPSVAFALDRPERIAVALSRRSRRLTLAVAADSGSNRVRIPARVERRLVPGRWRLEISAEGARRRTRILRVTRRSHP